MAHEIAATDGLVLTAAPAWHGLGVVVQDAPTPEEALSIAGLDWTVEQTPGVAGTIETPGGPVRIVTDTHRINVRSDTREPLGVVGDSYVPVQNRELAEFASALADGGAKIESAGSIRGGRRVWFLVRGESFGLGRGGKDQVDRYLLLANGHDGSLSVTAQPTSIRVVCRNTLAMALGRGAGRWRSMHTGRIMDRMEQAKVALGLLAESGARFEEQARALHAASMSREELQRFWLDVYSSIEGTIPQEPRNAAEHMSRNRAAAALAQWGQNFDEERGIAGANAWNAVNAVTRWYDHQRPIRDEDRTMSRLWGSGADRKARAFSAALELVS